MSFNDDAVTIAAVFDEFARKHGLHLIDATDDNRLASVEYGSGCNRLVAYYSKYSGECEVHFFLDSPEGAWIAPLNNIIVYTAADYPVGYIAHNSGELRNQMLKLREAAEAVGIQALTDDKSFYEAVTDPRKDSQ